MQLAKIVLLLLHAGALSACSLFDDSDSRKEPIGSGTGGGGGSGLPDGATGGASSSCASTAGPEMVEVTTPLGKSYCVDSNEVTQSQYAQFLAQVKSSPGSEHPECTGNGAYAPSETQYDPIEPKPCAVGTVWNPEKTPDRPVACVDWCDAYAYCAWAGKRLCGKVDGGAITSAAAAIDANQSQWFNACSQGGTADYPYGAAYDEEACESADNTPGDGWATKKNVASRAGCKGFVGAFASVFDMSGSVMEFTNECYTIEEQTQCQVRGGAYATTADYMACKFEITSTLLRTEEYVGFRCCKDL